MAVVVVEDVIMTVLVLTKLREIALNAISLSLKFAIAVAIGLFIAFIGPKNAGIVVADPVTCLKLGDFTQGPVLLAVFGLVLTRARRPGRSGWDRHRHLAHQPGWNDLRGDPLFLFRSFLDLRHLHDRRRDLGGAGVLRLTLVPVIFALFMTAFFDTMGTVIAIGQEAKLLDEEGRLPDAERILLVDALSAGGGGAMGASSVTSYIESGSGVAEGGRTGLTSMVVGLLFLLALPFSPLGSVIGASVPIFGPTEGQDLLVSLVSAPALIVAGFFMMTIVRFIPWDSAEEAISASFTIFTLPLTFSISYGIGFGFISYVLIKLARAKLGEVHPLLYGVAILFAGLRRDRAAGAPVLASSDGCPGNPKAS